MIVHTDSEHSAREQRQLFNQLIADIEMCGWSQAFSQPREGLEYFFPDKAWDVLDMLFQEVKNALEKSELDHQEKISQLVPAYVIVSLKTAMPYQKILRQALYTAFLYPRFLIWGLRCLYRLSDIVWKKSGDASIDFSFYTKRWILTTIYIPGFFSFLFDETEEMQLTQKRIFSYVSGWGKTISFLKSFFKK